MQFRDVAMDAMLEQREHLLIRIAIMENHMAGRDAELQRAREALSDVEARMDARKERRG